MISKIILNTRPAHQSENLTQWLAQAGMTVYHLPVLDIRPIAFDMPDLSSADYLVFLSANAVTHFFSSALVRNVFDKNIIAIGPATKKVLENMSLRSISLPKSFTSEGILDFPDFQQPQNKHIVIVSGKNPNPLLSKTLVKRGAHVTPITCYERFCKQHAMQQIFPKLQQAAIDTVIVTSSVSFECLYSLFAKINQLTWLQEKTLCVISEKMKRNAVRRGFSKIMVARDATDNAIFDAIV